MKSVQNLRVLRINRMNLGYLPDLGLPFLEELEIQLLYLDMPALARACNMCSTIQRLRISVRELRPLPIEPPNEIIVLPNLRSYTGPGCIATCVLKSSSIVEHLDITDDRTPSSALEILESLSPELRTLSISIEKWDDEVILAISQLFPRLQSMNVIYKFGLPTQVTTLHIFRNDGLKCSFRISCSALERRCCLVSDVSSHCGSLGLRLRRSSPLRTRWRT